MLRSIPAGLLLLAATSLAQQAPLALTLFRVSSQESSNASEIGKLIHSVSSSGNAITVNMTYNNTGLRPGAGTASFTLDLPVQSYTNFNTSVIGLGMTPPAQFRARFSASGTGSAIAASVSFDTAVAFDSVCFTQIGGPLGPSTEFTCERRALPITAVEAGRRVAIQKFTLGFGFSSVVVTALYSFEPFVTDSVSFADSVQPLERRLVIGTKVSFRTKLHYRMLNTARGNLALRIFDKPVDGDLQASSDFVNIRARTTSSGVEHPDFLEIKDFEVPSTIPKLYLQAVLIDDVNPRVLARSETIVFTPSVRVFVSSVEFVQVVQTEKNEIPLVLGKRAVARVFVKQEPADPQIAGITGELKRIRPTEAVLPRLEKEPIVAHGQPDRAIRTHSLNFDLGLPHPDPSEFDLVLDRPGLSAEGVLLEPTREKPMRIASTAIETLNFSSEIMERRRAEKFIGPVFTVGLLSFCVPNPAAPDGPGQSLCAASFRDYDYIKDKFEQRVPSLVSLNLTPGIRDSTFLGTYYYPGDFVPRADAGLSAESHRQRTVDLTLRFLNYLRKIKTEFVFFQTDMLVALMPSNVPSHLDGYSETSYLRSGQGRVAWVRDSNDDDTLTWSLLHEAGHNFGLRHTNTNDNCGLVASDSQTNWLRAYPDGAGTTHEVGFDVFDTESPVKNPRKFDFMTYCEAKDLWVSPFHYTQMIKQFQNFGKTGVLVDLDKIEASAGTANHPVRAARRSADPVERLLLSGWVARDGSGAGFDPVLRSVSARQGDVTDPAAPYCLEFHGADRKLTDHCFPLDFDDVETGIQLSRAYFIADVVSPAGLARVALVRQGQTLAEIRAGEPPSIRIASPAPGARLDSSADLTWEASSSAGELLYRIDISNDGGATWSPLALEWPRTAFPIAPEQLPAAGQYHYRVTAASGLNSASAVAGPFEVMQRPRLALPAGSVSFGETRAGQRVTREITLVNDGTGPVAIEAVESTNPAFLVPSLRLPLTIPVGGSRVWKIDFTAPAAGRFNGLIRLRANTTPSSPSIALEGAVTDPNAPRLVPPATAALDFGDVTAGQTRDLPLVLRNTGGSALAIGSVTSSNPLFRVTAPTIPATVAAGGQVTLTVRFAPTGAGAQTGTLAVNSNDPLLPRWEAALRGSGVAASTPPPPATNPPPTTPPAPQPPPATPAVRLDFGEVTVGRSAELGLTLNHSGSSPATVSSVAFSNAAFTGSPAAPFTIPAAGQRVYTVRFAPTATGVQTGTLTLSYTGLGTTVVNLVGVGLAAPPTTPAPTPVPPTTPPAPTGPRTVTLQLDDGTFERILSLPTGGDAFFINRITPPSYPATLRAVQVFFGDQGLVPGEGVTILSAAHPSGAPELAGVRFANGFARVTTQAQFQEFAVQPVTVESGDFLVGFVVPADAGLPVMPQDLGNYRSRSYLSRNGTVFELINAVPGGGQGNFAIRGVVEVR